MVYLRLLFRSCPLRCFHRAFLCSYSGWSGGMRRIWVGMFTPLGKQARSKPLARGKFCAVRAI